MRTISLLVLFAASCGTPTTGPSGGTGGGGSSSTATFPRTVKLQGTLERATRTWDSAGHVVLERSASASFSGTSTASTPDSLSVRYDFEQPFDVTGTLSSLDVTLAPKTCSVAVTGGANAAVTLTLVTASAAGNVARLDGQLVTSTAQTCPNGAAVQPGLSLDSPGTFCPDATVKVLSGRSWLGVDGDPHSGFELTQDVECDAGTLHVRASVEGI